MSSVVRVVRRLLGIGALLVMVFGCNAGCNGGSSGPPEPAPDFTLTDANQSSVTYGEDRQLSEVSGRVIVIHFALYT